MPLFLPKLPHICKSNNQANGWDLRGKKQLAWQKLKSQKATFSEILNAVETSDKKRFSLFYLPSASSSTDEPPTSNQVSSTATEEAASESNQSETATATALVASKSDLDPSHYLIRATQGHSIKSVQAESGLLEKLTLDEPDKLPETVVHGTFHSTWPLILASGGLKCMGRNHVHFATGPTLPDALADIASRGEGGGAGSAPGSNNQVISGMRRDAQVLVYLDVRKALAAGCPFWRSENGVILSEGMEVDSNSSAGKNDEKVIPLDLFNVVIERKKGFGKIWEDGKEIYALPEHLTMKGNPKLHGRR